MDELDTKAVQRAALHKEMASKQQMHNNVVRRARAPKISAGRPAGKHVVRVVQLHGGHVVDPDWVRSAVLPRRLNTVPKHAVNKRF